MCTRATRHKEGMDVLSAPSSHTFLSGMWSSASTCLAKNSDAHCCWINAFSCSSKTSNSRTRPFRQARYSSLFMHSPRSLRACSCARIHDINTLHGLEECFRLRPAARTGTPSAMSCLRVTTRGSSLPKPRCTRNACDRSPHAAALSTAACSPPVACRIWANNRSDHMFVYLCDQTKATSKSCQAWFPRIAAAEGIKPITFSQNSSFRQHRRKR